jgi:polysaccharide export outer membrane protein
MLRLMGLAALVLLVGCAAGAPQVKPPAAAEAGLPAQGGEVDDTYVIGQSDEIEVQVWQEPDLSRAGVVRSDGMISLPLINDIKAEGVTVRQLRALLTEKYKEVVADPVVSVLITRPLSATFFITGKVAKAGEYTLFKETTLLQAVATAGGFTEWAKSGRITVVRKSGERLKVNYDSIVAGDMSQNVILQRGDTVVVP